VVPNPKMWQTDGSVHSVLGVALKIVFCSWAVGDLQVALKVDLKKCASYGASYVALGRSVQFLGSLSELEKVKPFSTASALISPHPIRA
jgi:hypothetical protein